MLSLNDVVESFGICLRKWHMDVILHLEKDPLNDLSGKENWIVAVYEKDVDILDQNGEKIHTISKIRLFTEKLEVRDRFDDIKYSLNFPVGLQTEQLSDFITGNMTIYIPDDVLQNGDDTAGLISAIRELLLEWENRAHSARPAGR